MASPSTAFPLTATAGDPLKDYPELKKFVLSDVKISKKIGAGSYATVHEVEVLAVARKLHDVVSEGQGRAHVEKAFLKECVLISTLHHPNIVRFLGVFFLPDSALPALVLERMATNLHDALDPGKDERHKKINLSLSQKCSIVHDVASGLAYLHERSPPIIHRDLSATNVLLNSEMVAKISDLGTAHIVENAKGAQTMTACPGNIYYMPPEAISRNCSYNSSIDIFSLGVLTIFTISEVFPNDPLPATYTDENSMLWARSELERRKEYMKIVKAQLRSSSHPLVRLIQQCLHNLPSKRPDIRMVLHLLEEARASAKGEVREA